MTNAPLPDEKTLLLVDDDKPFLTRLARAMETRGADVGFLNAQQMSTFMSADAAKWKRVASYAKITLG